MRSVCLLSVLAIAFAFSACSPKTETKLPPQPIYSVATQKYAKQPTYYPVRWVRSPQPDASQFDKRYADEVIVPTFHYSFNDSNLCEIAAGMAASLKYSSYCASALEKQKYSVDHIATPFELKDFIEKTAGIKIVIDRLNREVRFLAGNQIVPQFSK